MIQYTEKQKKELDKYFTHPNNLVTLFEESVDKFSERNLFGTKNLETQKYEWVTYSYVAERVNNLRAGINALGLKKGESIGVILNNSVEWYIIEQATHGLGGRFVPMYEKELKKIWKYIVADSEIKYLFVSTQEIYEQIKGFIKDISTLKDIFIIYGTGEKSMADLEEKGKACPVESYKPHWSEMAELIYTSGTTGDPKGVLLTHGNLTHCSQMGRELYPELLEEAVSLSILPWAHSYGLSAELHALTMIGGSIAFMESVATLPDDLASVSPTFLIAVPRVFNKIYDALQTKMKEEGGLKKKLFDAACAEAVRCRTRDSQSLKLRVLDKLVFSKIRDRFGGKLKGVMTASAVMNADIARFFKDVGIPTYDCYGLTETSPAITMNSPVLGNKYGTVGRPIRDMYVTIDRDRVGSDSVDGEVVAYGAHVMMGYHKKPKQTKAIMVEDTWNGFPGIRTGDLGKIDEEGFLSITGRYKDEYKLSNGKYVHPDAIETEMKLMHHLANAFIHGDGKAYNVSIIVPDFEALKTDPEAQKWSSLKPSEIIKDPEFVDFITNEIKENLKKSFGGYEIPRGFIIIEEDFTVENGMLTQTMKLKRREVLKKYGDKLEKLYKN